MDPAPPYTLHASGDRIYEPRQFDDISPIGSSHVFPELYVWTTEHTPYNYLDACERIYYWTKDAERHKAKLIPSSSLRAVVSHAFSSRSQPAMRFVSLPRAVICDFAKPPYHLARMVVGLSLSRYYRIKAESEVLEEIIESLSHSLTSTFNMIVRLHLETRESVEKEIQDRGFGIYQTLARLLEAYGSRSAPSGSLYLASNKRLLRSHCHGVARLQFDHMHKLKSNLLLFDLFPTHTTTESSEVFLQWLQKILPALKHPSMDGVEHDGHSHVLQKFRNTQAELSDLLLRS